MNLKSFMELFDNWNIILVVNDNDLQPIVKGNAWVIMEEHPELYKREIVAFGFCDGELCVRVK